MSPASLAEKSALCKISFALQSSELSHSDKQLLMYA